MKSLTKQLGGKNVGLKLGEHIENIIVRVVE